MKDLAFLCYLILSSATLFGADVGKCDDDEADVVNELNNFSVTAPTTNRAKSRMSARRSGNKITEGYKW